MNAVVNISLYLAYGLLAVAAIAAIVLPVMQMLRAQPKELIKLGVGVGSTLLLFLLSYLFSVSDGHICDCSKLVGALLLMVYVLLALNFLGILYLSVVRFLR